jgi:hypothetical protein
MPQVNIFQWLAGNGWLVLSGGGPAESDDVLSIEAAMLGHTVSLGPIAYVWAASDIEVADQHMDVLRDLGARTGYLVDILTEEDDLLFRQLAEAGVIIIGDGPETETLRQGLMGTAIRGIEDAYRRGATVYAIGQSAALLGAYLVKNDGILSGFGWLAHSLIVPGYTPEQSDRLRDCLQRASKGYGLGVAQGAAIAFGARGEVEVWGNAVITVALGPNYDPNAKKIKKRKEN